MSDQHLPEPTPETSAPTPSTDGIDRRNFLSCMAWAGTGLIWSMVGGVPTSKLFATTPSAHSAALSSFSFVQISDSHIGFNKDPRIMMSTGHTSRLAIDQDQDDEKPVPPELLLHTGDITHSVDAWSSSIPRQEVAGKSRGG